MRLELALLALWCAGCSAGADDDYPIMPGGGGPGGNGGNGGVIPSDDAGAGSDAMTMTARVCVLLDPRDHSSCATSGADGIIVTLGSAAAVTEVDGSFTIASVMGANLVWRAAGAGIVPSVMPFTGSASIPAITTTGYQDLISGNGALFADGSASIFIRVIDSSGGVPGATGTLSPVPQSLVFYDGTSAVQWDQDATGNFGMIWIPETAPGLVDAIVRLPDLPDTIVRGVPLENQSITYVTVAL